MPVLSCGFFYIKYPEETNSWGRNKTGNYQRMEKEPVQRVRVLLEMISVMSIWWQLYSIINILKTPNRALRRVNYTFQL